ncbi:MAG: diaminopimelate epimerase, partial [Bacteroidales bacterium]|nr:diaminopimelate epimerase [Bacteroidales bacterium]
SLGLVKRGESFSFEAPDGLHEACVLADEEGADIVELKMRDVERWEFDEKRHIYLIDTGSPHYIRFVENCGETDVVNEGKRIRYSEEFPAGINVDFVEILKEGDLWVRTYERGVEDETFACGTGVTASALAFALEKGGSETHHDIQIHTRGGDLRVAFDRMAGEGAARGFHSITLTGPACKVFEGVYRG